MKKIFSLVLIFLAMAIGLSAFSSAYYGSCTSNPCGSVHYQPAYINTPVRVGGFFGGGTAYLIGLRSGAACGLAPGGCTRSYYSYPSYNYGYARTGGYFGNYYGGYSGYSGYSSGMYKYGGSNYANVNYMYSGFI
jgi:hypothetical protein